MRLTKKKANEMELGEKIKLHIHLVSRSGSDKPIEFADGEFIIIGIAKSLPHCFAENSRSGGYTHFEYGQVEDDRPGIVQKGSVYLPNPQMLSTLVMKDLHYDRKIVSWERKR